MSFTTQKSYKVAQRDKPKHSSKDITHAKKGGAGGKGTWGAAKDDVKYMNEDGHAFDDNDPNYDPVDQTEGRYSLSMYTPVEKTKYFANTITDLNDFKKKVRDASKEYLVSHDSSEFITSIKGAQFSLFHQDLPAILIKYSLDQGDDNRVKISQLLHALFKDEVVTATQMAQGFRKLYHGLDDLTVDAPNARVILAEFVGHGHASGYLDAKAAEELEQEAQELADFATLKGTKGKIHSIVTEYFSSNELEEFRRGVEGLKASMQFEVVKQLVSLAMDLSNTQREKANVALAALVGSTIALEQACKGLTILLNRVEDMYLDVPDILHFLSCIIARAIADEAIPPSFLLRLDLAEGDMGFQVASQAQALLDGKRADLEHVWA